VFPALKSPLTIRLLEAFAAVAVSMATAAASAIFIPRNFIGPQLFTVAGRRYPRNTVAGHGDYESALISVTLD
jgi:hypothetical protein